MRQIIINGATGLIGRALISYLDKSKYSVTVLSRDVINAKKSYEAATKTLEARNQAYNFSKERYDVGLLNAFDFSQSTNAFENAQSEVLRTKYDYIFRTKILEFYFGIPLIKQQ